MVGQVVLLAMWWLLMVASLLAAAAKRSEVMYILRSAHPTFWPSDRFECLLKGPDKTTDGL